MTSRFRVFVCGLCLLMSADGLQGQELVERIDGVMDEFVELDLFSGTVLVARGGEPIYTRAFGEANKDHHVANVLETRFNIGSIGKTLTGTAVMQLVERDKVELDAAIAVFELNVERFPDEPNCYDSLGEAYLLDGQREKGIAAYKKALEVDPQFENARQVLEQLGDSP